jgi:hypothetical protein
MLIKPIKFRGKNLNCLKFKRIIGKDGTLKADNIHVVMTNLELMRLYEKLGERFSGEQFMAVKVPKKKVTPKPAPKKSETVALFGMVGTEVEL